ncbi:DUF1783-domain-containing protein [Eremomyces bilateralis CBS 781.70]|uniref:DUF1783-domain-containing protein n=1 Tax=Eremomyces bilateralis CBS 781.70 TaxID=1392243 RepID=A0A6G1G8U2_9PEZI|nr:DUF1783-domain-containing protein [Eremomyces bilateralis CBS 781.70]KAF1814464.1 DUF1783-domain-containing protein [Eremomyces bilateralis CBS 781.70]
MLSRSGRPVSSVCSRLIRNNASRRTLVAAPKPNSGPLMSRRSDRALPDVSPSRRFLRTLPLFALAVGASTLAIFNYQKLSSSTVSSTLYALRVNDEAREILGDEIFYASKIPWIWGSIDQLHGRIDIQFSVKGTKGRGWMRFRSERKTRMGYFETLEWSLKLDDGRIVDFLHPDQPDPFQNADLGEPQPRSP